VEEQMERDERCFTDKYYQLIVNNERDLLNGYVTSLHCTTVE
jgi:hypothetical protein